MRMSTRKLLDKSFTSVGGFSILLMGLALLVILTPIFMRGLGAFFFTETVEHREFLLEEFERGDLEALEAELEKARKARQPIYDAINAYEVELFAGVPDEPRELSDAEEDALTREEKRARRRASREREDFIWDNEEKVERFETVKQKVRELLGPLPGEPKPVMKRAQYGATRWERAEVALEDLLMVETWDYSREGEMGTKVLKPRVKVHEFENTALEPLFAYAEEHAEDMLLPKFKFYYNFLFDKPVDQNMFGGIWPPLIGTFYLTFFAMLLATPFGVIAAIYFVEYAGDSRFVSFLRVCVSTLAGVPSIVFGLFGLAFLINTVHLSHGRSVLAGAVTLSLLVLPTVIRSAEEAIKAVPNTYREAAMGLGASKWRTITTVILPAALSGILTGTIISMGRAAGETAPIIFTAAVSFGEPLRFMDLFDLKSTADEFIGSNLLMQETQALPWNIYNIATEHPEAHNIRHTQYGMVVTLVSLVLMLNLVAIILRARISKKLRG